MKIEVGQLKVNTRLVNPQPNADTFIHNNEQPFQDASETQNTEAQKVGAEERPDNVNVTKLLQYINKQMHRQQTIKRY